MRKALLLAFGLLVSTVALAPPASSDTPAFGVSPAELRFVDPPTLRGQEYTAVLKLSNRQDAPTSVTFGAEDAAGPWLSFTPASPLVMEPRTTKDILVKVKVPADAPNGEHFAKIRVRAAAPDVAQGTSGSAFAVELVPSARIIVGGDQVVDFTFESLAASNATAGRPVELVATIVNTGNVRAAPSLAVRVLDAAGQAVLDETLDVGARDPRSGGPAIVRTTTSLPAAGDYTATGRLFLGATTFGTKDTAFKAASLGSGKPLPQGRLLAFGPDGAAEVGKPVRFEAHFRNTGTETIDSARLSIEVFSAGSRVAAIGSDALKILAQSEDTLVAYWSPTEPGTYSVRGFVVYDGLKATIAEQTVKVEGTPPKAGADTTRETEPGGLKVPGPGIAVALTGIGLLALLRRRG